MHESRETVLRIASAHSWLLWSILLSIMTNFGLTMCRPYILPLESVLIVRLGLLCVALAILTFQVVCVVRLCLALGDRLAIPPTSFASSFPA